MKIKLTFLSLALAGIAFNCTKNEVVADSMEITKTDKAVTEVYNDRAVYFTRSNAKYTQSMADTDFGNFDSNYFTKDNAYINSNQLRVRIPKNTKANVEGTQGSGFRGNIDVSDGTSYELSYKIKFESNFKWSRGGKCGFGIIIGRGASGCDNDDTGYGGSARLMWYSPKNEYGNESDSYAYFHPYLYTSDKEPGKCGTDFGTKYENIKKDVWYTVVMRVRSNTGSTRNGYFYMSINGTKVLEKSDILWTSKADANNKITEINTNNFRGGSDNYWMADTDGYIRYDDVKFKRLPN